MVEDRRDVRDEVRLGELAGGEVDADDERPRGRVPALPVADLLARRLEHPAADRQDESRLLRERDERQRRHEAADRVLPAEERLHADHPAAAELHERLVVEAQLRPLDGAPKVVLERGAVQRLGVHLGVEHHGGPDGVQLRPVERDLGLLEEVPRVGEPGAPEREAQAGADVDLTPVEVEGLRDRELDPRRDTLRLADAAHRAQQDPELVRAEPGHGVRRPRCADEPPPDLGEQQVAGRVPEALVDDLEPVEVEEDERDPRRATAPATRRAGPGRAGARDGARLELVREPVEQQRPVRQAREQVVECRVGALADLRLGSLEEPGVVERDRRELCEPGQRLHLALAERTARVARGEADDPEHLVAGRQRHGAHRAERVGGEVRARGPRSRRSRPRPRAGRCARPPSRCRSRPAAGSRRSPRTVPCRRARRGSSRRSRPRRPRAGTGSRASPRRGPRPARRSRAAAPGARAVRGAGASSGRSRRGRGRAWDRR